MNEGEKISKEVERRNHSAAGNNKDKTTNQTLINGRLISDKLSPFEYWKVSSYNKITKFLPK